jgi:hypothetical protein
MVAYTSPDCLPYYECTDSPCLNTGTVCEPSTVWCDLTALLETRLNGFDGTVSRTAVAVPFAKVARFAVQLIDVTVPDPDLFVHFDTVLADNANMVDLDADDRFITVTDPGIYHFEVYMSGLPTAAVANGFQTTLATAPGVDIAISQTMWRSAVVYNRLAEDVRITQADIDILGSITFGVTANQFAAIPGPGPNVTVNYCEMTCYWTAED